MKNLGTILLLSFILITTVSKADQFFIADGDVAALKAAIIQSNSNNKPDTIHLAPFGTYSLTTVDNVFLGKNGLPTFVKDVSDANYVIIFGNGATITRDSSITELRLLYFVDCKVSIYDTNLVGGATLPQDNDGAAMLISSARITLQNCLLKDNHAAEGGAIWMGSSTSSLTAKNCTFTGNVATFGTGAVIITFYGNTTFQNCVIVNNSCLNVNTPAAIYNSIPLNANTTNDNIFLKNCIVAKNTYDNATSPDNGKEFDIGGAVYTQGNNVIGVYPVVTQLVFPTFRQGLSANGDNVGTDVAPIDPLLGTLGDHGLFTDFYNLLTGSPALVNNAGITGAGIPAVASNGVVPTSAYPGDIVTITGINLAGITKIQFPGAPTTTTGITATARTVTVPVHPNTNKGQIPLMDAVSHFIFTNQVFKVKVIVTPAAPANLNGIASGTSSVTLSWNDVSNEDNYRVDYKKQQDVNYSPLQTLAANTTTFVAGNLDCHTIYNFRIIALGHGTESAPSNEIIIAPLTLSAPSITQPQSTDACSGNSVSLVAPVGFAFYKWSTNETTSSIEATSSGSYSVQVTDANGCTSSFSTPVVLTFYDYPDTTLNVIDAAMETPVVADYQWYYQGQEIVGETNSNYTAAQAGTYKLQFDDHGCISWSRDVVIPGPATPTFITSTTEVCAGTTAVTYTLDPISGATYNWSYDGSGVSISSGAGTNSITIDFDVTATSGNLLVDAELNGFRSQTVALPIAINHAPMPLSGITGDETVTAGSEDNIYSVEDPGDVSFIWSYSGTGAAIGENNHTASIDFGSNATAGILSVSVSNDCGTVVGATLNITIQQPVVAGLEEHPDLIRIFPNPSGGRFTVDVTGRYSLTISNLTGKVIYNGESDGTTEINLNSVAAGPYLVMINTGEKVVVSKIILY